MGGRELDIRVLGMSAPRFLMFKVEDEVTVVESAELTTEKAVPAVFWNS